MKKFDFNSTPIIDIVNQIIINSVNVNASDIHFDPSEKYLKIRLRIDGELVDYSIVENKYKRNLITRIKLMAGMNITESRLPQDGAIKKAIAGKDLDMRVSCLPASFGEKIVIRILDYTMSLQGLETLGFTEENYDNIMKMISNPNGIILVTGATGSGKSTTVYSMLHKLNKEETNIITVEDPVEMNIEGLNQVQVNSEIGLTFASVLRSILRQDPNIILIGEIRDTETAQIAIRASITGHLVLSTLHTNNSLTTIERLTDMNVERYLLSSSLKGIISQTLAKRICPHCRIKRKATKYEKKLYKQTLNLEVDEVYDASEKGCEHCHNGYTGRIALQEVLAISEEIRDAINDNVDRETLRELIYNNKDLNTMLQDGLLKVLKGITSMTEVLRLVEIDKDFDHLYKKDAVKELDSRDLNIDTDLLVDNSYDESSFNKDNKEEEEETEKTEDNTTNDLIENINSNLIDQENTQIKELDEEEAIEEKEKTNEELLKEIENKEIKLAEQPENEEYIDALNELKNDDDEIERRIKEINDKFDPSEIDEEGVAAAIANNNAINNNEYEEQKDLETELFDTEIYNRKFQDGNSLEDAFELDSFEEKSLDDYKETADDKDEFYKKLNEKEKIKRQQEEEKLKEIRKLEPLLSDLSKTLTPEKIELSKENNKTKKENKNNKVNPVITTKEKTLNKDQIVIDDIINKINELGLIEKPKPIKNETKQHIEPTINKLIENIKKHNLLDQPKPVKETIKKLDIINKDNYHEAISNLHIYIENENDNKSTNNDIQNQKNEIVDNFIEIIKDNYNENTQKKPKNEIKNDKELIINEIIEKIKQSGLLDKNINIDKIDNELIIDKILENINKAGLSIKPNSINPNQFINKLNNKIKEKEEI